MAITKLAVALLLFALCVFLPSISAESKSVNYCRNERNYDVKVSGVDISPYPVQRGKNATFSISAVTDKSISNGKLVIDVKYFGWDIHSETHDLCSETSCPVPAGSFVVSHSQVLPGITPPGSFTLKMSMVDEEKHELTCITFDFTIGFGFVAES
ncbi:hypothetical protein DM860_010468 [Cuscuta australis]|uniref:MD-2-related lipid-recognition domain-containing protein n=1 Tax=Cuscuta australis TaxID=267555 RepID=A0A328E2L9_9ASTE|nr:hypothetical protein DM860_010468 [Cuscuta australis]